MVYDDDSEDELMVQNEDSSAGNRGYTEESLKMLETDEGQSNAVFACYGSAAQHAQLFERGLVKFLMVYNEISSETLSADDFQKIRKGLGKATMGRLIQNLLKHVSFPESHVPDTFGKALECRNFLMHYFFLERQQKFTTAEGRFELLGELVSIEQTLDAGRVVINAMRIALCETAGIEDKYSN
jgi:hypothetical protein